MKPHATRHKPQADAEAAMSAARVARGSWLVATGSFLHKLRTMLSVQYAGMLEYRAEMFLWVISGSLPLILAGVWAEAAGSGELAMAPADYARYFFCTFVVRQMTLVWVVWEFETQVVQGTLAFRLLQPIDPMWHHIAEHLAERAARIPVLIILAVIFFLLFPKALTEWRPSWSHVGLGVLAIAATFILRFTVQYAFAMLAFWIERAHSVEQLWYLPYLFVSGLIAPLDDFPAPLREALMWTPFPYLIYFPAKLLMGQSVPLTQGFIVMTIWTVAFWAIHRTLWRMGLKHFSAMGA